MAGENPVHNLFVHYGEEIWEERNIIEECSFFDVLSICNNFIDVYSVCIKITDAEGRPLTNDKDLMGLLKEQVDVKNISIYLHKDTTIKPLNFKLPQDNPAFVSVLRASQVGDVLVEDSDNSEMNHHISEKNGEDSTKKVRKVKGANKIKTLVALKKREKLEIEFFQNRAIGPNHQYWSRHLGKIVRNKYACPIRVHTWKEITESEKQHMWDLAKEKFHNPRMDEYREHTLEHMDTLWTSWRSSLNVKEVRKIAQPTLQKSFFATRQKKGKLVEPTDEEKYDELVKIVQVNESLSPIAFVDTCFGPQNHSKVFGFGGRMKRKYFYDPRTAYIEQIEAKLQEKEEENDVLWRRVEGIESMLTRMVNENQTASVEQPFCGNDLN